MRRRFCFYFLLPWLFFSCASHPEFIYLKDLDAQTQIKLQKITHQAIVKIQPFDFLHITVYSVDPTAAVPFNPQNLSVGGTARPEIVGYKVDEDGNIDFPVVGKVKVVGESLQSAADIITKEVEKYLKEPVVSLKFLNLKVTVIGEVNRPGTFDLPVENMTILQVIGLAGDVSITGDRSNLLVIREQNGERSFGQLNLLKNDLFTSPFYHLQQNDVIVVRPSKIKDSQINAITSREVLPWISGGVSLVSLLIAILK